MCVYVCIVYVCISWPSQLQSYSTQVKKMELIFFYRILQEFKVYVFILGVVTIKAYAHFNIIIFNNNNIISDVIELNIFLLKVSVYQLKLV